MSIEPVTKVAANAIDALKSSPGLLVVLVLQCVTMVVLYFVATKNNDVQQKREMYLLEQCLDKTDSIIKELQPEK